MMKFVILFALVAAAAANPLSRNNLLRSTGRILGGVDTTIEQVPYQVSVRIYGFHNCGGSIISETWILSAAHCFQYPLSWLDVRSGSTFSTSGGTISTIAEYINHEDYAYSSTGIPLNDISLIRLSSALTLDSTQAIIPLISAEQEIIAGTPAVVTGWGFISMEIGFPTILQTVTIPIVSKADCSAAWSSLGGLPAGQICAGVPEGDKDSCSADSGGPLAINGVLAGIVSWGETCGSPGFPGVYAEVAAYRTWITQNSGV